MQRLAACGTVALKAFRVCSSVPGELKPLVERRVRSEKYESISAYVAGLIIFDLYCRRPHVLTSPLMREPLWLRDEVIPQLVKDFEQGNKPGGWFEHRIQELIQERTRESRKDRQDG